MPDEAFRPAKQTSRERESEVSEFDDTRKALADVSQHEFRFGYQYAFEEDRVTLSWEKDKSLSIGITPCQPEDDVWFGNCYDDAWVSREFLKTRVGEGASISVQKIEADSFVGRMDHVEHYRLLVEHNDESGNGNSVFAEIDHSSFFRKTASGEQSSVHTWVETDEVREGARSINRLKTGSLIPMCEYEIDGREKILYFSFEIDEGEQAVYIRMQQIDSTDQEQKLDALRYPIYFKQLDNPQKLLDDIEKNPAFKPDGPFGDQMHETTLNKMRQGLSLVVAKLPPFKH